MRIINGRLLPLATSLLLLASCMQGNEQPLAPIANVLGYTSGFAPAPHEGFPDRASDKTAGDAQIPVLCYHQVRDWKSTDSKFQRTFIVPVATFKEQIKILHDSGYHTITPDQLTDHLTKGKPLPSRPIMLTFDDADGSQYDNALPELDKAGFKGVFFIMTVVLGHKNYLSREQVKYLYTHGHTIACHTWNHKNVTKYTDADWPVQIEKPRAELEKITGSPVKYFAYPYGIWNAKAEEQVKKYGFTAAFQLSGKMDKKEKMFSIRRIIVDSHWNGKELLAGVKRYF
jgi:peptidoglycan/xylan/chitin deacetylase (PgdA/CDA1 family)